MEAHQGLRFAAQENMSKWYFCSSVWREMLSCTMVNGVTGKSALAQA